MMTWATTLLLAYAALGLVAAVATLRIFPPMEGFRPSMSVRISAGFVFALLWPFLVMLAAWYFWIGHNRRVRKEQVCDGTTSMSLGGHVATYQHMPISKPR